LSHCLLGIVVTGSLMRAPEHSASIIALPPFPVARLDAGSARARLEKLLTAFFCRVEHNLEAQGWREARIAEMEDGDTEQLASLGDQDHTKRVTKLKSTAAREMKRKFGRGVVAPRLQIAGSPGLGKTRIVIDQYRRHPALWTRQILYFAPTIDLCHEFVNELNAAAPPGMPLAIVLPGRDYVNGEGQSDCARAKVIRESQHKVSSVYKSFCDDGAGHRCPHYDSCPYISKRRDQTSGIRASAHANLTTPQSGELSRPPPDLVIVDEACYSSVVKHARAEQVSFGDLATYCKADASPGELVDASSHAELGQEIISQMILGPGFMERIAVDEKQRIRDAIKSSSGMDVHADSNPALLSNRLRAAASAADNAGDPVKIVPGDSDEVVRNKLKVGRPHPGRGVAAVLRQVAEDYDNGHLGSTAIEVVGVPGADDAEHLGSNPFEPYLICHGLKKLSFKESTPLLLIDADAILRVNNRIFCRGSQTAPLRSVSILAKRRGHFVQCHDLTFSTSCLAMVPTSADRTDGPRRAETRRAKTMSVAVRSAGANKRAVVTMSKRVRVAITGEDGRLPLSFAFTERVEITHFGRQIGQNRWRKYDIAVVVGRDQPTVQSLERLGRAIYGSDRSVTLLLTGQYIEGQRPYGPASSNSAFITTHPDPRLRELLEAIRERSICQAIDRLRLCDADGRDPQIFVLCKLPLPGIVPNRLLPAADILAGGTKIERAIEREGFFTTNAKVLAGAFPDLWETPKAAEHDIRRRRLETPKMQEENILYAKWGFSISTEFRVPASGAHRWSKIKFEPGRCSYPESVVGGALGLAPTAIVEFRGEQWEAYVEARARRAKPQEGSLYYDGRKVVSIRQVGHGAPLTKPMVFIFVRLSELGGATFGARTQTLRLPT
jgi:hypothetical protein